MHGYHPWAEDGGLYAAGVEYLLDPSLFPHERAFVTEHLSYSVFAPSMAALTRLSHLPLSTVLFCTYLISTLLTLFAALSIARRCFSSRVAHWTTVALLAAWWTLPVAGTSLLLMDPYVTARSLSTPLSLIALASALQPWDSSTGGSGLKRLHPAIACFVALVLAAMFHPLMALYAFGSIVFLRFAIGHRSAWLWTAIATFAIIGSAIVQLRARPEAPPEVAAVYSRYYWFLSQWHWFELLGLLGPLLIFALALRWSRPWLKEPGRALCQSCIAVGLLATLITLIFAQEHYRAHAVARLQPLRCFLLIYAIMVLVCGGALAQASQLATRSQVSAFRVVVNALPTLFIIAMACTMFAVQRDSFASSIHIELPGRSNPNPWVESFLWARNHTPVEALFAMDARYINTEGEDAQTFRAIAQRSAIPDYSKDGGEAAITPRLAAEWQRSSTATQDLSKLSDAQRDARLRPFGVQWFILQADGPTSHPCPYRNAVVKICRI